VHTPRMSISAQSIPGRLMHGLDGVGDVISFTVVDVTSVIKGFVCNKDELLN
jgi:hypothetical protein